ncbi:MAG TPA: glycerophosphodiester phosphodiesterase [Propionibacteriaceae bacterium]|nr:glycerophosphodiester phosphodiesterase [Propionibacteriaceae bacterium]
MTAVWAHRGASKLAPENTLEAFDLARRLGADGIELDVQLSCDGRLVVIHDDTIDRTSNGSGAVAELTLAELRAFSYDAGMDGFANVMLPELVDVFELLIDTDMVINVELKADVPGMGPQIDALVEEFGLSGRVIYSSFNHYALRGLRDAGTRVPLGLLIAEALIDPWIYAKEFGASALHPFWMTVMMPGYVQECHDAGIAIHAWTVNNEDMLRGLATLGVDAVITDDVELALRVVGDVRS